MSRGRRRKKEEHARPQSSRWSRYVDTIVHKSRPTRLALVSSIAIATTFSISPLVDMFYIDHLFSLSMPILPALFSSGIGIIVFIIGWWLLVGIVGETPQARPAILWYFGFGLFVMIIAIIWLSLWITGNASLPLQPPNG